MIAILKAKYAFISSLLFYLVANPETYRFTESIFGSLFEILSPSGAVTPTGLLVHTALFFLTMWALMMIPAS
jgi:hypothetical protein